MNLRGTKRSTRATKSLEEPSSPEKPAVAIKDTAAALLIPPDEASESEHSDFAKKSRKRTSIRQDGPGKSKKLKSALKKRSKRRAAALPGMSESESSDEYLEGPLDVLDGLTGKGSARTAANTLSTTILKDVVKVVLPGGLGTLDLNLKHLSQQKGKLVHALSTPQADLDATLVADNTSDLSDSDKSSCVSQSSSANFLSLEPKLRNDIYRAILIASAPIEISEPSTLPKTGALLRVCKQVYHEGRSILYGENTFHFARKKATRGRYYEAWKEIGYKDVRRFLESIGQHNIACMRYVSMSFDDIFSGQYKTHTGGQKFATDPVVYRICDLLGESGAILDKFVIGFVARSFLDESDYHFIKSFVKIRCRRLIETCRFGHSKTSVDLMKKLEKLMLVNEDKAEVSKATNVPQMQHERFSIHHCHGNRKCRDAD